MGKADRPTRKVRVLVPMPWDRANECVLEKVFDSGKPDLGTYESWEAAAQRAVSVVHQAGLDEITLRFLMGKKSVEVETVIHYDKSGNPVGLAVSPMVEVEKHFNSRGYETQYIGAGRYMVEKPDGIGGTRRKKGFPDVTRMLELSELDNHDIDDVLNEMWLKHVKTSKYREFILTPTIRGGNMGKKKEEKEAKPTAKGAGGKDVELSPKKVEVLAAIEKGEKQGKPYGSGDERLPDPESIAAMQLARDGVAHRVKIGTRWHYWKTKAKADAELKAAEAEAAKVVKKAPAKAAKKAAATGRKKAGKLKKPSEK